MTNKVAISPQSQTKQQSEQKKAMLILILRLQFKFNFACENDHFKFKLWRIWKCEIGKFVSVWSHGSFTNL